MNSEEHIPKFYKNLFRALCRDDLYHELAGDLEENFAENIEILGVHSARSAYKKEVLQLLRPSVLAVPKLIPTFTPFDMLKNYFKISVRNLIRDKKHSLISIFGLAAGVVASVLIFQYVNFENSYDQQHDQSDGKVYRVSRVSRDLSTGEIDSRSVHHYMALAETVVNDLPEVKASTHLFPVNGVFTYIDKVGHQADNSSFTTAGFFEVFDFPLLEGDAKYLDQPGSVYLSQSLAKRIFDEENALDKIVRYNDVNSDISMELQVKGVYQDIPTNSHFEAPALMSSIDLQQHADQNWFANMTFNVLQWRLAGFHTYIKAVPGVSQNTLDQKLVENITKYRAPYNAAQGREHTTYPQAIEDLHFVQDFDSQLKPSGDKSIISLFQLIGILIILIAWTNFINLSSAKAIKRAKEIGVRKSLGAFKAQLMQQFLLEALLVNILALIVAIGIILLVIPKFHQLTGIPAFDYFNDFIPFWSAYLGFYFLGSLLTGLYPALVLTKFDPIEVLRGNFKSSSQGVFLRKGLMFTQFAIVLIMLSGIMTIRSQIKFMMNQDIGMNFDQTLVIDAPPPFTRDSTYGDRIQVFQGQVESNPLIKESARSSIIPGERNQAFQTINRTDRPSSESILLYLSFIDEDFEALYDLEVIAGRGFNRELVGDGNVIILNEEAVKQYDFKNPEDAIGKHLAFATTEQARIVGVVKDFNNMGPKFSIDPLALQLDTAGLSPYINVRVDARNVSEALSYLQATYHDFFPGAPFNSFFADQTFQQVYEADHKFNVVLQFFAIVAIFISCLGIFGLSSFLINNKMKEVSIRKVLGANVSEILRVLTMEYIWLVTISTLVAIPISYFLINNWLNTFLVRVNINPLYFVLPIVGLLTIIFITIGNKTTKAARSNPARVLKNE